MSDKTNSPGVSYLLLIAGCVTMGTVGVFANMIESTHPLNVVFLRILFSFLSLLFLIPLIGKWRETVMFFQRHRSLWLACGINMVLVMTCYITGTLLFSVGLSIVLLYTAPLWLVLWNSVIPRKGLFLKFPRTQFGKTYFALVAVNLAGLAMLVLGTVKGTGFLGTERMQGFLLAVLSGLFFSLSMVLIQIVRAEGYSGEQMIFSGSMVGTTVLLPGLLLLPVYFSLHNIIYAIPLGILATAFGGIMYFRGFERLGPSRAPIIAYIEPLVGIVLGILVMMESYPWLVYIGVALILGSGIYEGWSSNRVRPGSYENGQDDCDKSK